MESDLTIRSRQSLSGPQIFFLLADFVGLIGGSIWDVPITLPFPCNTFFIASIRSGDEANSVAMYFQPLNRPRGSAFTSLNGTEQIFYLNTTNIVTGPFYRSVIKFKESVTQFFLAIGTENGGASRYTIGCTNDKELKLTGGIYT
jgi:hypothetical protein